MDENKIPLVAEMSYQRHDVPEKFYRRLHLIKRLNTDDSDFYSIDIPDSSVGIGQQRLGPVENLSLGHVCPDLSRHAQASRL